MKKLSILIALILCVTIGGVYATWNYAQGNVTSQTKFFDNGTTITNKVISNAKGVISVDTSNLKITIHDNDNDLVGQMSVEGYVTVSFEANQGADASIASEGIELQYVLGTTENYKYNGNDIFTVNTDAHTLNKVADSVTIPASELDDYITLNTLNLPTSADYDAFKLALHGGSISITVSEVTQ